MQGREEREEKESVEGKEGKKVGLEQAKASRDQGRARRWRYHLQGTWALSHLKQEIDLTPRREDLVRLWLEAQMSSGRERMHDR
jgi:hypothetical protein